MKNCNGGFDAAMKEKEGKFILSGGFLISLN